MKRYRYWGRRNKKEKPVPDGELSVINTITSSVEKYTLTFLLVAVYCALAIPSQASLIKGDLELNLPIFNVTVPIKFFVPIATIMVITLHVNILYKIYALVRRTRVMERVFENQSEEYWPRLVTDMITLGLFQFRGPRSMRLLSRISSYVFFVLVPQFVMGYIVIFVIPLRQNFKTYVSLSALVIDFGIILMFVPYILSRTGHWRGGLLIKRATWRKSILHSVMSLGVIIFTPMSVLTVASSAVAADECSESWVDTFVNFVDLRRNFNLDNMKFEAGVKFDNVDLRCAEFRNIEGKSLDFRGADISGAIFDGAILQDPKFGRSPGVTGPVDHEQEGISFKNAILKGFSFENIKLTGARFDGAVLTDGVFRDVEVFDSFFGRSMLCGIEFNNVDWLFIDHRGSSLDGPKFAGTSKAEGQVAREQIRIISTSEDEIDLREMIDSVRGQPKGEYLVALWVLRNAYNLQFPPIEDPSTWISKDEFLWAMEIIGAPEIICRQDIDPASCIEAIKTGIREPALRKLSKARFERDFPKREHSY